MGFIALAILGEKRYSILNTIAPGAALGFSFVMLGESLGFIGILGMAISIGGMIWFIKASDTKELEKRQVHEYKNISKGVLFGILSGLCQGLQMTLGEKSYYRRNVTNSHTRHMDKGIGSNRSLFYFYFYNR